MSDARNARRHLMLPLTSSSQPQRANNARLLGFLFFMYDTKTHLFAQFDYPASSSSSMPLRSCRIKNVDSNLAQWVSHKCLQWREAAPDFRMASLLTGQHIVSGAHKYESVLRMAGPIARRWSFPRLLLIRLLCGQVHDGCFAWGLRAFVEHIRPP